MKQSAAEVQINPSSARQMRSDVRHRRISGPHALSPVILNHRPGDSSDCLRLIKELIRDMYAENPPWRGRDSVVGEDAERQTPLHPRSQERLACRRLARRPVSQNRHQARPGATSARPSRARRTGR